MNNSTINLVETVNFNRAIIRINRVLQTPIQYEYDSKHFVVYSYKTLLFGEIEKIIEIVKNLSLLFYIKNNEIVFHRNVGFVDNQ